MTTRFSSTHHGRTSVAAVSSHQDFASHQRLKNQNVNRYQIFHDCSSLGYAIVAYRYYHRASKTCTRIPYATPQQSILLATAYFHKPSPEGEDGKQVAIHCHDQTESTWQRIFAFSVRRVKIRRLWSTMSRMSGYNFFFLLTFHYLSQPDRTNYG